MTKDEALKMAIEVIKDWSDGGGIECREAIEACKEALEQPKEKKYLYAYVWMGEYAFVLERLEENSYDGVFIGKIELQDD